MKTLKENSPSHNLLLKFGELLDLGFAFLIWDFEKISKMAGRNYLTRGSLDRIDLSKSLYSLKRGSYIKTIKTNKEKRITLTKKGEMEIIKYKIKLRCKNQNGIKNGWLFVGMYQKFQEKIGII